MKVQRRGFIKTVTTGLAIGYVNRAFGQTPKHGATGEIETSSASLQLRGGLKSGTLTLDAQEFLERTDRSVIVHGKLNSTDLYSAMFSHAKDRAVFALVSDSGHSTTLVLFDSADPKIGQVVIWHDNDPPQIYKFDKRKIAQTDDPKEVKDVNGKTPDLVGNRKPPQFTWQELESVFGSDEALLQFMRGKKSTHHPREEDKLSEWICRFVSLVPGSTLSLFWLA